MAPAPMALNEKPTTGGATTCSNRRGLPPLWHDEYFWICDGAAEFVQVRIRRKYNRPMSQGGMGGTVAMSKQIMPCNYGETRDAPVRSLLLLRAWAVWRARQDGWADARSCRKHSIGYQERLVERAVRALDEPCRLLGDKRANRAFQELAPDMALRFLARR